MGQAEVKDAEEQSYGISDQVFHQPGVSIRRHEDKDGEEVHQNQLQNQEAVEEDQILCSGQNLHEDFRRNVLLHMVGRQISRNQIIGE